MTRAEDRVMPVANAPGRAGSPLPAARIMNGPVGWRSYDGAHGVTPPNHWPGSTNVERHSDHLFAIVPAGSRTALRSSSLHLSNLRGRRALEQNLDDGGHVVLVLRIARQLFPDGRGGECFPMLVVRVQVFAAGHVHQAGQVGSDQRFVRKRSGPGRLPSSAVISPLSNILILFSPLPSLGLM